MFHSPLFLVFLLPLVLCTTEIGSKAEELKQITDKGLGFIIGAKDKAEDSIGDATGHLIDLAGDVKGKLDHPVDTFHNVTATELSNLKVSMTFIFLN